MDGKGDINDQYTDIRGDLPDNSGANDKKS